ncbi:MAG: triose-phosphate isomerase [Planctomycetota bacterium]|nr:triose-phosphate isomerase [Planctomycetota bacterium]
MARTPSVGGNWKMNTDRTTGPALARDLAPAAAANPGCEVAVFVPFPYLLAVGEALGHGSSPRGTRVRLGAQDCYFAPDGAYTGEVSIHMLKDCGVSVVLTGHSERRHVLGETDQLVNAKTRAVLDADLECVLCIGETLDQRQAGRTDAVNEARLRAGLAGVTAEQMAHVTIAYEPVWAIGTGKVATPADAQTAHARCRAVLAEMFDSAVADATRIIYGGSMKPTNAAELLAEPDIDGGLIGGASLKAADFLAIVEAAGEQT